MRDSFGLAGLALSALATATPTPQFLPRGDKIICRDRRGGNRVVDRKIWAKLDAAARGRWIDRIRVEQGA
jgi:hypothetical protein